MKGNRFLTKSDYFEIITEEALGQIIKDNEDTKFRQAEESAEMSIIEYLTENYEIERELENGKRIIEYDKRLNYSVGNYFEMDGNIYKVIRSISGYKVPASKIYWEPYIDATQEQLMYPEKFFKPYSQLGTYYPEDLVIYNGEFFICVDHNGYDFGDIRIPGVVCWQEAIPTEWQPEPFQLNALVSYNDKFYMLYDMDGYDETITPDLLTTCWGEIADYDETYEKYELSPYEFVVYDGKVFFPIMNVNPDEIELNRNVVINDPRNRNIRKHMIRLALYELVKNITPNNISVIRKDDYDESMAWLEKANKMKINPGIPRKLDDTGRPNLDWGIATFQKSYDPYENAWQV